jgi:hypothetical protein
VQRFTGNPRFDNKVDGWGRAFAQPYFSKSDCWASPFVFVPGTLWRTWGTRLSSASVMTSAPNGLQSISQS